MALTRVDQPVLTVPALELPTASSAVAMAAVVAEQGLESPSASSVAKVEELECFEFHQTVLLLALTVQECSSVFSARQKNLFRFPVKKAGRVTKATMTSQVTLVRRKHSTFSETDRKCDDVSRSPAKMEEKKRKTKKH